MNPQLARSLIRLLLRQIRSGTLVVREAGAQAQYGRGDPVADVTVRDPRAWSYLLRGSRGLAESYAQGWWESSDLPSVIRIAARNASRVDRVRRRLAVARRPLRRTRMIGRPSTRRQRRADIAAHYDLGDELFSRMLDPTMTYSCAVFAELGMSLEAAQRQKMDLICRKLELSPAEHVLEIGTGWGGFALHAASAYGCRVTTTTISARQHAYAVQQVQRAGLEDKVTVLEQDYRDLRGRFDRLVSIEMIEAVGWRHTGTFLETCSRLLAPEGAMLLQAITIDDRLFEAEKASRSFIKNRIFPGGSLPSVASLTDDLARRTDLRLVSLQDLTPHYVPTLRHWRQRLTANARELSALGYDRAFQREWTLYLAYCEAGFAERRIGDVQMLLAKPCCLLPGGPGGVTGAVRPDGARVPAPQDRAGSTPAPAR
jgi:cyclopropane-fatty-acyl-phospholipid synthase